jgi:8-amino-7-oxononanoate synthase
MNSEHWIAEELGKLQRAHLVRHLSPLPSGGGRLRIDGRDLINFSSNDYLDFLGRPELKAAAREATERRGTGTGSSQLVTGHLDIHQQLETRLATEKGAESALVFGSGFLTNLGVIAATVGRGDTVLADRLVHASIIDAIRLSGATLARFKHNDMQDLADQLRTRPPKGRVLIVSESVFSMDGDLAPLTELVALAGEHGAMVMIDEAHATGVFGPNGSGLLRQHGLSHAVNLAMCTFSKALGGYGGAVTCSATMREWLVNTSRALIYTTALPPGVCASALAALDLLDQEPHLGEELLRRAALFRRLLHDREFSTGNSASQIIPVVIGENDAAIELSQRLRAEGFLVTAIRPPTVPAGTARLRFSITLAHHDDDLERAADALHRCGRSLGVSA